MEDMCQRNKCDLAHRYWAGGQNKTEVLKKDLISLEKFNLRSLRLEIIYIRS